MTETSHGSVGTHFESFSRLVPARRVPYAEADLLAIARAMDRPDTPGDGPDAEENLYVPAGYTYLGQFIDHDLTLDTTSNLNPDSPSPTTNLRTPSLDLDCLYGSGPADQTFLYESDGATLRIGRTFDDASKDDLLRNTTPGGGVDPHGRAIIGDKRNDENSIVCQIQLAMIKFHNAVVAELHGEHHHPPGFNLFKSARQEVQWSYQRMIVEDYLKRIIEADVYDRFFASWADKADEAYVLYPPQSRHLIPLEFAAAAYRFGHSMVRVGYRLNTQTALPVFDFKGEAAHSLTGFQPLPGSHVIDDWGRFFPAADNQVLWPGVLIPKNIGQPQVKLSDGGRPAVRLQFAYKIDPNLTGPLGDLPLRITGFDGGMPAPLTPENKGPALSLLNLRRGNKFLLASGQRLAARCGAAGDAGPPSDMTIADLQIRQPAGDQWTFSPFPAGLQHSTPLWLFILAEAQRKIVRAWTGAPSNGQPVAEEFFLEGEGAVTQLGPVGGRLLLETFFGLLDADTSSYFYAPSTWQPLVMKGKIGPLTFSRMLEWTGLPLSDAFGV